MTSFPCCCNVSALLERASKKPLLPELGIQKIQKCLLPADVNFFFLA